MSSGDSFRRRPWEPSRWALMTRGSCSECRASIFWMSVRDLAFEVEPGDRLRVFGLVDLLGGDATAWLCPLCRAWGVFDGAQLG